MPRSITQKRTTHSAAEETVYVFQGGGSLGAYQVGIMRGLRETGYSPNWVVGTSIGAINAAIVAGNPYETRLQKLEQFWNSVLWPLLPLSTGLPQEVLWRRSQNHYSAFLTLMFGVAGFFTPRTINPLWYSAATPDQLSFYDTAPLRHTLQSLIDFDYLNSGEMRLSLGAVDVQSGEMVYFDNRHQTLRVEHIMASGALPPGFPAVEIDGRFYWDGGLYSNTPIDYVLEHKLNHDTLCFTIQLIGAPDEKLPSHMDEVERRKKEISFGSRYKEHLQIQEKIQKLRRIIAQLGKQLPKNLHENLEIASLLAHGNTHTLDVVHFCAPNLETQLSSKDYEFSAVSAKELMEIGYRDALRASALAPWDTPMPSETGIRLHEIYRGE